VRVFKSIVLVFITVGLGFFAADIAKLATIEGVKIALINQILSSFLALIIILLMCIVSRFLAKSESMELAIGF
jgi:hypothetical protein